MIDPKVIEEIKSRNPIEEVMSSYVTLKRAGSNMLCSCPFHSEKTPSCTVFLSQQSFYCFGCGAGGDVITFIRKIENLGYIEALEHLAKRAGINFVNNDKYDIRTPRVNKERYYSMNKEAAKFFREMLFDERIGKDAREYLSQRQISPITIKRFGLGYAPDSFDRLKNHLIKLGYTEKEMTEGYLCLKSQKGNYFDFFRDRLMFPVIDTTGNIIAFGGRIIHPEKDGDAGRKYMNSSDTPVYSKRKNLYALNYAKTNCAENMILCEGYMDVISMHQAGFENAVATLGTAITSDQARLISRYAKKVIISYDSDAAGQNAANKAIKLLEAAGVDASVLRMSGAKDPDEYIKLYGASAFSKLLEQSRSPFRFKVDAILSKYNMNNIDQKIKAISEISEVLADIPQKIERELYARQIAGEFDIKYDNISDDINRILNKKMKKQKEDSSREILRRTAGYSDRVNPDFAKNVQGAKAEEHILSMMMLFEEHRRKAASADLLSCDDFVTEFGKKAFEKILELENNGVYSESALGEFFTVEEISRLKKIQLDRVDLSDNSAKVFDDCVKMLKRDSRLSGSEDNDVDESDIMEIIRLRKKQEKNKNTNK